MTNKLNNSKQLLTMTAIIALYHSVVTSETTPFHVSVNQLKH